MPDRKSAAGKTVATNTEEELWFSRLLDYGFAPEWSSAADERAYAHLEPTSRSAELKPEKPRE